MKILASKQYSTYEDYVTSGRFNDEQLLLIKRAFLAHYMTPRKIKFIANPEYTPSQMAQLLTACAAGRSLSELALAADPRFSPSQMYVIFQALRSGISAEEVAKWADPDCPKSVMRCLSIAADPNTSEDFRAMVDMVISMDVSDRARNNILDAMLIDSSPVRELSLTTLQYLQGLIARGASEDFIDGISWYAGFPEMLDICALYEKYPRLFVDMSADQVDSVVLGAGEPRCRKVVSSMVQGAYSSEQVAVLLQCLEDIGEERMEPYEIGAIANPEFTAEQMKS